MQLHLWRLRETKMPTTLPELAMGVRSLQHYSTSLGKLHCCFLSILQGPRQGSSPSNVEFARESMNEQCCLLLQSPVLFCHVVFTKGAVDPEL